MLPIYFGRRYRSAVKSTIWRPVICDRCGYKFAYQMTIEGTGSGTSPYMLDNSGAQRRAYDSARRTLDKKAQTEQAKVPCPQCGYYHASMVAYHKKYWRGTFVGAVIGLVTALLSFHHLALAGIGMLTGIVLLGFYWALSYHTALAGGVSAFGLFLLYAFLEANFPSVKVPITLTVAVIPMVWAVWRGFIENLNANPEKNKQLKHKYRIIPLALMPKTDQNKIPDTAPTS